MVGASEPSFPLTLPHVDLWKEGLHTLQASLLQITSMPAQR